MNKQRLEAERLIYKIFDTLDPTGDNTDFWKKAQTPWDIDFYRYNAGQTNGSHKAKALY